MTNLKVAEYRDSLRHLERLYSYNRHMCVGQKEKDNFDEILKRIYSEFKTVTCRTAKIEDIERQKSISTRIEFYLLSTVPVNSNQMTLVLVAQ